MLPSFYEVRKAVRDLNFAPRIIIFLDADKVNEFVQTADDLPMIPIVVIIGKEALARALRPDRFRIILDKAESIDDEFVRLQNETAAKRLLDEILESK